MSNSFVFQDLQHYFDIKNGVYVKEHFSVNVNKILCCYLEKGRIYLF